MTQTQSPTSTATHIPTPTQQDLLALFEGPAIEFSVEEFVSPSGLWNAIETRSEEKVLLRHVYQYVRFELSAKAGGKTHVVFEGVIETTYESIGFQVARWLEDENKAFIVQRHSGDGCFPFYFSEFQEINLETGAAQQIGPAMSKEFSLSPDAELLASTSASDLEVTISSLSDEEITKQLDYLHTEDEPYVVWWMSGLTWSPDSSSLAIEVTKNACFEDETAIVVMDATSMEVKELFGFDMKLRTIDTWTAQGIRIREIFDSETRYLLVDPESGDVIPAP